MEPRPDDLTADHRANAGNGTYALVNLRSKKTGLTLVVGFGIVAWGCLAFAAYEILIFLAA